MKHWWVRIHYGHDMAPRGDDDWLALPLRSLCDWPRAAWRFWTYFRRWRVR